MADSTIRANSRNRPFAKFYEAANVSLEERVSGIIAGKFWRARIETEWYAYPAEKSKCYLQKSTNIFDFKLKFQPASADKESECCFIIMMLFPGNHRSVLKPLDSNM